MFKPNIEYLGAEEGSKEAATTVLDSGHVVGDKSLQKFGGVLAVNLQQAACWEVNVRSS
jgi:hypothetical protein